MEDLTKREHPGAQSFVPEGAGLVELSEAARGCRGCELYLPATQTVFGSGAPSARIVLVGEQPGDVEDRLGEPFVGPAGRLLDRALADAGIERDQAYITNAVKHFRFTNGTGSTKGKRRIHQKPDASHMAACRPWLDAELSVLSPELVVALGATAAAVLIGPAFRVTRQRGQLMPWDGPSGAEEAGVHAGWILATVHPSSVLRTQGDGQEAAYDGLVSDLKVAAGALAS
ncbi:MAG: UdgX family uracil-DNA binding protein [bacterium]